jgi:hypothetical protein
MTAPAPADLASQPLSESVPAPSSTADPGSKTDSDPQLAFVLLPRPRSDAPSPPPSSSGVGSGNPFGACRQRGRDMRVVRARGS